MKIKLPKFQKIPAALCDRKGRKNKCPKLKKKKID